MRPVGRMQPAKEFPAAREHFGETSTLELSFPRLDFAMRYQKLSPQMNHARITQESNKRTVQAFHLCQDSAIYPLLCNNKNTNRGPLQLQYSAAQGCHVGFFNPKFLKIGFFLSVFGFQNVVWFFGSFLALFFSSRDIMSNHVYTKNFGSFGSNYGLRMG